MCERNKNTCSTPITKRKCYHILSLLPGEQEVDMWCDSPNNIMANGGKETLEITRWGSHADW